MARTRGTEVAHALRVLAEPASVLALVVLVLNDHVLKQAYPGVLTGKLSDVAGLVVAPLLLAVGLSTAGVWRPLPWAVWLTGTGFLLAKTSVIGAAVTSVAWSLTGVPTVIRADPTDLLALPALGLAWWVDRSVRRAPVVPWRRTAAVAVGAAVLPCAVLATAATSCDRGTGITHVSRVKGDFPGRPRQVEQRLVLGDGFAPRYSIDAMRTVADAEVDLVAADTWVPEQCDPTAPDRCWRVLADGVGVERSEDRGLTWETELELTDDQVASLREGIGDDCGDEPTVTTHDLGLLPTDGEPVVVAPIGLGGAFIREEDARWQLHPTEDLYEQARANVTVPPQPEVTPLDQPPPEPPEDPSGSGTPTCASPSATTVTPNPSNGPPTTYDVCLDRS